MGVLTLKEDGTGVMAEYLSEGEDPFALDLEWNKPMAAAHPLGIDIEVTASLLAPNAIRMVTMAKEMMLSDVQTMTFTGVGIRKLQWRANQASHTMVSLTTRLRPGAALKSELTRMEILPPFPSTPPCLQLTSTDSRKI